MLFSIFNLGPKLPSLSPRTVATLSLGLATGAVGAYSLPKFLAQPVETASTSMVVVAPKGGADDVEVFAISSLGAPTSLGTIPTSPRPVNRAEYLLRCRTCLGWTDPLRSMESGGREFLEVPPGHAWHTDGCTHR